MKDSAQARVHPEVQADLQGLHHPTVILERLATVVDARTSLAADELIVGRLIGVLKAAPTAHVEDKDCIEAPPRIAFAADGVGFPRDAEPIVDLAVKIDLLTQASAYSWVNAKLAWGSGHADLAANKIHVEVYLHCGAGCR